MLDDADASDFDPPDTDAVYARYLETCRRTRVEPVPRDRAQDLMAEWSDAIAASRSVPPLTHKRGAAIAGAKLPWLIQP